jgi:thiol-disulfide isomerase/thioredoxin
MNANPTLSRKFEDYHRMSNLCTMAQELSQSWMYGSSGKLPQSVKDYINATLWPNIIKPYTLSREMSWLIYYYSLMAEEDNPQMLQKKTIDANTLLQMAKDGEFQASDNDLAFLKRWQRLIEQLKRASKEEIPAIEEQNKELIEEVNVFAQRSDVQTAVNNCFNAFMNAVKEKAEATDAVFTDPVLRDIAKSQMLTSHLQRNRMPLTSDCMDVLQKIQLSAARKAVLAESNKYATVQQTEIRYPASLRPSSDVEGLTDGEAIFRKIIDPFKGRIVYLDIWGTWCAPCREKLAESPFVKSQLKDFDIVYLYLANRSPEDAWKSIIKEYDLTGENCVHYNLPAAQQRAVEEFLKVESFPTYKLIDKQGNIHDLEWLHTSNMDLFKETLTKLNNTSP